jgi:hypothetical protein
LAASVVACLALLLPAQSRGGGSCEPENPEDFKALARLKAWRAQGDHAIPAVLRALCGEEYPLRSVAEVRLLEVGARMVPRLLDLAAAGKPCGEPPDAPGSGAYVQTLGEVLCHMQDDSVSDGYCASRSVRRDRAAVARAISQVAEAAGAPAPARRLAALSALAQVASRRDEDCPPRARLLAESLPNLIQGLSSPEPASGCQAAAALERIGPAGAPALPALRRMLADPGSPCPAAILRGLAGLGAEARPALQEIRARLVGLEQAPCDSGALEIFEAAGPALARIGGSESGRLVGWLLIPALRGCQPSALPPALQAMRELGTAGEGLDGLRTLLRDSERWMGERCLVAEALRAVQAPLADPDRRLQAAISRKCELSRGRAEPQLLPPPAVRAREGAAWALSVCRREAGIPGEGAELPPPGSEAELAALDRLAGCLGGRVCGPEPETYRASVSSCCESAFGPTAPTWCR